VRIQVRPGAWAEIDTSAIQANVGSVRHEAGTAEIMAVVKADGYGHGLIESAAAARAGGAAWLGVAYVDEALALRAAGDTGRILAWLHPAGTNFRGAITEGIDLSVGSVGQLSVVASAAADLDRRASVHLKVDTGLLRGGAFGLEWDDLVSDAVALQRAGAIEIVGIWTHLSHGDEPDHDKVTEQVAAFERASIVASRAGVGQVRRHLANSGPTLVRPDLGFDIVRPGLSVYGLLADPRAGSPAQYGLRPAMTVRSSVISVKQAPAGSGVSYSHRYVTPVDTRLAVIPIGYGDGLPRAASNHGSVLVGGQRAQVAGSVCMDQIVVDLGADSLVCEGMPVVVFGPGDDGEPTAADWALASDTIVWEIVTRLGSALRREYR